jgi:hypothetical protein
MGRWMEYFPWQVKAHNQAFEGLILVLIQADRGLILLLIRAYNSAK